MVCRWCAAALIFGWLSGCGNPQASESPARPIEIEWFKGTLDQALATAKSQHKPLLVYWGAVWCPYCQALKKSVFTRADFVEKTRLFVPVYFDGDLPGAQTWGEKLKISGYPTMLVLRPDRTELARLSGGMDLTLYASLIDEAIHDERPIQAVLTGPHTAADCHRLAYYGWDPDAFVGIDAEKLAATLKDSAARCHGNDQIRLEFLSLNFALQAQAPGKDKPKRDATSLKEPVLSLFVRLAAPDSVSGAADLLAGFDDNLYAAVLALGPDFANQFRERYVARMREAANNPRLAESDRLIALASTLDATKALSADHTIPASMQEQARERVDKALRTASDRFARNDIVNGAGIVYDVLGDDDAAVQMYLRELPNTKTPYYYMSHLAALAEKHGKTESAIIWYAKAYAASLGPVTRVRWGGAYVRALIRLTPTDAVGIRAAALQLANEMSAPDAQAGRSHAAADRLRTALATWATTRQRRVVSAEIAARLPQPASATGG